ncbi:hypothetical protein DRO48_00460 [Candidatus Bathyarchaeota archaeon]|nr:MAG: hypothetical protein DRO48_00460 [Candidatus Bathyarchaeota archaeon]
MVYHLRYWKQVRDHFLLDPLESAILAIEKNEERKKFCPKYDRIDAAQTAEDCSKMISQEGFEACLAMSYEDVCGVALRLEEIPDEYFKAWDRLGEAVNRIYEEHKLYSL